MAKHYRLPTVHADPRFLYSYSPEGTAADRRFVFTSGEHTYEHTAFGLRDAYRFVTKNPPTERDHERRNRLDRKD